MKTGDKLTRDEAFHRLPVGSIVQHPTLGTFRLTQAAPEWRSDKDGSRCLGGMLPSGDYSLVSRGV